MSATHCPCVICIIVLNSGNSFFLSVLHSHPPLFLSLSLSLSRPQDLNNALSEADIAKPGDSGWLAGFRLLSLQPQLNTVPALASLYTRLFSLTGRHARTLDSLRDINALLVSAHRDLAPAFADDATNPGEIRTAMRSLLDKLGAQPPTSEVGPLSRALAGIVALTSELADHRATAATLTRGLSDLRSGIAQVTMYLSLPELFETRSGGAGSASSDSSSSSASAAAVRAGRGGQPSGPQAAIQLMQSSLQTLAAAHSPVAPIMAEFITLMSQVALTRKELALAPARTEVLSLKAKLAEAEGSLAKTIAQYQAQVWAANAELPITIIPFVPRG